MEHQKELDQWLTRMHQLKWNHISPNERLSLLQELENIMAKAQGRKPMQIRIFRVEGGDKNTISYGKCTNDGIYINEKFVEDRKRPMLMPDYYSVGAAINTILHEGRHAWQKHLLDNKAEYVDDTERAKMFLNYVGYSQPGTAKYYAQLIEVDARRYARQQYQQMMDRMQALGWNPELVYYSQQDIDRRMEEQMAAKMKKELNVKGLEFIDIMLVGAMKDKITKFYPKADLSSLDIFEEAKKLLRGEITEKEFADGKKLAFSDGGVFRVSDTIDAAPALEDAFWKALGAPIDREKQKEKPDDLKIKPIGFGKTL